MSFPIVGYRLKPCFNEAEAFLPRKTHTPAPNLLYHLIASMRPRHFYLGKRSRLYKAQPNCPSCFNEAEAFLPRKTLIPYFQTQKESVASMRPRHFYLGKRMLMDIRTAPIRFASMRPRHFYLGKHFCSAQRHRFPQLASMRPRHFYLGKLKFWMILLLLVRMLQ